jgi:hypothetical protein
MANSISVAVDESETIASGSCSMVTDPLSASTVTGNPELAVVVVVAVGLSVVVVTLGAAVVDVLAPMSFGLQAAATSSIARSNELLLI